MRLTRAQRFKMHEYNKTRIARGLKTLGAEALFMSLGEAEQRLTDDRNEKFPYDLYNRNYRNNGNIANIDNPTFTEIERGGYAPKLKYKKDRIQIKTKPFSVASGEVMTILSENLNREYLFIQSALTNTTNMSLLFYSLDSTGELTVKPDAVIMNAGAVYEFDSRIPVNPISIHNPTLVTISGMIIEA